MWTRDQKMNQNKPGPSGGSANQKMRATGVCPEPEPAQGEGTSAWDCHVRKAVI